MTTCYVRLSFYWRRIGRAFDGQGETVQGDRKNRHSLPKDGGRMYQDEETGPYTVEIHQGDTILSKQFRLKTIADDIYSRAKRRTQLYARMKVLDEWWVKTSSSWEKRNLPAQEEPSQPYDTQPYNGEENLHVDTY